MPIDHKDEYATLRQEMLQRFDRIHDTTKYGVVVFIAFLSFYLAAQGALKLDSLVSLIIMNFIISLITLSVYHNFEVIYTHGTYIAVMIEEESEAKWHRMRRSYPDYIESIKKKTWRDKLRIKWGGDSKQFSYLILVLTLFSFGVIYLKEKCLNAFMPSSISDWIIALLILILLAINLRHSYKLSFGMKKYRENIEKYWIKYRDAFGKEFCDPYKKLDKAGCPDQNP